MARDIWNPWHGCHRVSEGCAHCYMFALDAQHGRDGSEIYRVQGDFDRPLQRDRQGRLKVKSGQRLRVCMTSDFFLAEADAWRDEAWRMIRLRPDVHFLLLTKRAQRIRACLPRDWGDGWENVSIHVSVENQARADERIPLLLALPARHRGVMAAPLLGPLDLRAYLAGGGLASVSADGENYAGARPLHYEWVQALWAQCRRFDVPFSFYGTGARFVKDGRTYQICRAYRHVQAQRSGLQHPPLAQLPPLQPRCAACPQRERCHGCRWCGRCAGGAQQM